MAKITNACLKSANQMVKCDSLWQVHGLLHVVQGKHGSKRNQYGHRHQQNQLTIQLMDWYLNRYREYQLSALTVLHQGDLFKEQKAMCILSNNTFITKA